MNAVTGTGMTLKTATRSVTAADSPRANRNKREKSRRIAGGKEKCTCPHPAERDWTQSARARRTPRMGKFSAAELDSAFRTYWQTGAVGENWDAWAELFTEDALYVEHVLGNMH